MAKKVCPHCGNHVFAGTFTYACIVETTDNPAAPFTIMREGDKSKGQINVVKCMKCNHELSNEELIEGVTCSGCGKVTTADKLNADGLCVVCQAKKERAELMNASPEQLIEMLIAAEQKASGLQAMLSKVNSAAEAVIQKAAEAKTEEQATEEEPKKTRKKRSKVKAGTEEQAAEQEDAEESAEVTQEEAAQEAQAVDEQQEAPFPDIPQEAVMVGSSPMPEPVEPIPEATVGPQTEPVQGFNMFEDASNEPF